MLIGLLVPCHNEQGYIETLLDSLLPQLDEPRAFPWTVVLVNDSSTDDTLSIVESYARRYPSLIEVVSGRYGTPGGSRSAGAAALLSQAIVPEWLVTVDADVTLQRDWCAKWEASFTARSPEQFGAINGGEIQDHLYTDFPNALQVSAAFGEGLVAGERAAGITNLNGVNHAIRTTAYTTCGPYVQPTMPGVDSMLSLAGEDWDLGLRIRRAGFTISETDAAVVDRGRRFLANVYDYVSGHAYEGAFTRLHPSGPSTDVPASEVASLRAGAFERSLRHFFFKPVLAGAASLDDSGLSADTIARMRDWMSRWPHPTFEESRNGFIFGRLERFSHAFTHDVQHDLGLTV